MRYVQPFYREVEDEERFGGVLIPFIGGALLGGLFASGVSNHNNYVPYNNYPPVNYYSRPPYQTYLQYPSYQTYPSAYPYPYPISYYGK